MKSVFVHAILLAVALPVAYLTWTRDTVEPGDRAVALWEEDADDIVSITFRDRQKVLQIDRRSDDGDYLWGTRVSTASGADSAAQMTGPDSVGFLIHEEDGERVLGMLGAPSGIRDLGAVSDSMAIEFGFSGDTSRVSVVFPDGTRELLIGGLVFGSGDRYVKPSSDDHVYVLSAEPLNTLMGADQTLTDRRLHVYPPDRVAALRLTTPQGDSLSYLAAGLMGTTVQWVKADAPDQPDIRLSNLMGQLEEGAIVAYRADLDPSALTQMMRAAYLGPDGQEVGFLEFYERPGSQGAGEYLFRSEHTRVPVQTYAQIGDMLKKNITEMF